MTDTLGDVARDLAIAAVVCDTDAAAALVSGGKATVESARRRVSIRTRRLSNAISAGRPEISAGGVEIEVGPWKQKAFYGPFVEKGTPQAAAQPYLDPALPDGVDKIASELLTAATARIVGGARGFLGGLIG